MHFKFLDVVHLSCALYRVKKKQVLHFKFLDVVMTDISRGDIALSRGGGKAFILLNRLLDCTKMFMGVKTKSVHDVKKECVHNFTQ